MRWLVLSDIHGNLEALNAVLTHAGAVDRVLVLGDLVGYGADPNAVIDRTRALPNALIIRGNHDKVATGLADTSDFRPLARAAVEWTARVLTPRNHAWLRALPQGPVAVTDFVEICHGTPFDEDYYVVEDADADRALRAAHRPVCLFGHTHIPMAYRLDGYAQSLGAVHGERFRIQLAPHQRHLINCGAVGQPRDGDARAAYGLLDDDARTLTVIRVDYDIASAQAKILGADLPEQLAQRLAMGR